MSSAARASRTSPSASARTARRAAQARVTDPEARHYAAFLRALGLDLAPGSDLASTPARVTELLVDWTRASREPVPPVSFVRELVVHGLCEHHLVPFSGHLDLAMLPGARLVGFDAFARLVGHLAREPQLQERMTVEIAEVVHDQGLELRGEPCCHAEIRREAMALLDTSPCRGP